MKRKLAIMLVAAMTISTILTGCGKNKQNDVTESTTESSEQTDNSSSTESGDKGIVNIDGSSEGEVVDISTLYEKSAYETLNFDDYVTIGDYEGLITLKESNYTVSEEDIQAEIAYYCSLFSTSEIITDRVVEEGDVVNIDFAGTVDGEAFDGGTASDYNLGIGTGNFIDGFEDGLVGVMPGETVELNLTFPEDFSETLGGKDVVFTVTVNHIYGAEIPAEFNDELVVELTSGDYTNTEDFIEYIKMYILTQKKQEILSTFKEELAKITEITGDLSEFIEEEYEHGVEYYTTYASALGYSLADFSVICGYADEQEFLDDIRKDSEEYVNEKVMLYAFGYKIGYEMSEEEVKEGAERIVSLYGYGSVASLLVQYNESIIRYDIFGDLIVDQIINLYK